MYIKGDARILDLDSQFIGDYNRVDRSYCHVACIEAAQGVMFQCPKCAQGKEVEEENYEEGNMHRVVRGAHYVICWFRNPRQARTVPADALPTGGRWLAWGTNLSDLTLTTSVHLSGPGCGWHGYVRDGVATLV